jgi:hypothetical protein
MFTRLQASEALEELCMAADELPPPEMQALLAGSTSAVAALRRTVVDVCLTCVPMPATTTASTIFFVLFCSLA